nr:unnamed protein product [Callosobruchus analis]
MKNLDLQEQIQALKEKQAQEENMRRNMLVTIETLTEEKDMYINETKMLRKEMSNKNKSNNASATPTENTNEQHNRLYDSLYETLKKDLSFMFVKFEETFLGKIEQAKKSSLTDSSYPQSTSLYSKVVKRPSNNQRSEIKLSSEEHDNIDNKSIQDGNRRAEKTSNTNRPQLSRQNEDAENPTRIRSRTTRTTRKPPHRVIFGTATTTGNSGLKAVPRRIWIYVPDDLPAHHIYNSYDSDDGML